MGSIFTWLIVKPMGFIIKLIYDFIPNYGVALIIFTVLIKLLILPLNLKSQKSMVKQQKLTALFFQLLQHSVQYRHLKPYGHYRIFSTVLWHSLIFLRLFCYHSE